MSDDPDVEDETADREVDVEDQDGHGIEVEGGGEEGASAPEETEEVDAERPGDEPEPDAEDEMREEEAADAVNADNHRDEEPFQS